jgi:hypothetical protein
MGYSPHIQEQVIGRSFIDQLVTVWDGSPGRCVAGSFKRLGRFPDAFEVAAG